mmetsp:Transcript_4389/g.7429  ORF Transcript_4389/g.7429 Transcript_4389/m.7429 type:complete len:234 (+) Transcript_4389:876-1577(+)
MLIEKSLGSNTSEQSLKVALTDPMYRRATWVNIGYILFHELTGINVIILYSNSIFKSMSGSGSITPKQGTYLVGFSNMIASLVSTQAVKFIGRRTLVIWGHALIAVAHALIAYLINDGGHDTGVIFMILAFVFIYQNTSGPVAWLYAAETTIDAALGVCLLTLWGSVFLLSIYCPILLDPDNLGPSIVFLGFSGISVLGTLYSFLIMKETKGLSDKEKKALFYPKRAKLVAKI